MMTLCREHNEDIIVTLVAALPASSAWWSKGLNNLACMLKRDNKVTKLQSPIMHKGLGNGNTLKLQSITRVTADIRAPLGGWDILGGAGQDLPRSTEAKCESYLAHYGRTSFK